MAAEEETVTRFHQKCSVDINLSDKNTTATATAKKSSLLKQETSLGVGTVLSSVPLHQLLNNRFVVKTKFKHPRLFSIWQIGVTISDPGALEEIPLVAVNIPNTWCVDPFSKVNKRKRDLNGQYNGDIWCVEVTPGGQVYIYHNYSQPWGSPVFTLPPDTTQVWAVVTSYKSTISVVQNSDTAMLAYDTSSFLCSLTVNSDKRGQLTGDYIRHVTPMISKSKPETTQAVYRSVVRFCYYTNVSCTDLRRLLVTGNVIEMMKRLALITEVSIPGLLFPYSIELVAVPGFIHYNNGTFLKWAESGIKSESEFLLNILSFINLCGKTQNELYFPEVDSMLGSILNSFVQEGNRVNRLDVNEWAPLHYTVHLGFPLATQELLRLADIDVNLENKEGDTPLNLAMKSISNTTSSVSTNYLDTLVVLTTHSTLDLNALDKHDTDPIFALLNRGVQRLASEGLMETKAFDWCWKDELGRSLLDYNLRNIDRDGWEGIRPFINYIMKNCTWTGHKILPDENSADVSCASSNGSEDRRSHCQHSHHSLNTFSLRTREWLLTLDEAIQIPGHTQQSPVYNRELTQGIGRPNICKKCVAESREMYSIAETYALKAKEEIQQKFPELQFDLQAMGSYIQDLKILLPDEFDFLLIIDKHSDDKGQMCDGAQKYAAVWFLRQSELVQKREHPDTNLISVYPHGPAWCLEFRRMKHKHECSINVDISLAVRHVGKPMTDFCKKIEGHRYFDYIYSTLTDDELSVNLGPDKPGVTSCTIMMKLIARLSYKLPHVATVIRIVKFIVSLFFPKRIIFCELKHSKYETKNFFSSHTIMSTVLNYLDVKIEDSNCWSTEQLPSTVRAVMKMLRDKMAPIKTDYFLSENYATEMGIFDSINLFLKEDEWIYEQLTSSLDTLTYFAIVKVGSFVKVRTEEELIELCRPSSTSADRPTVVAYIIPDHPLLQADSKQQTLSQLMCHFKSYLLNKFKDLPVRD